MILIPFALIDPIITSLVILAIFSYYMLCYSGNIFYYRSDINVWLTVFQYTRNGKRKVIWLVYTFFDFR